MPGVGDIGVDKINVAPALLGLEKAVCGELIFSWVLAWPSKAFSG